MASFTQRENGKWQAKIRRKGWPDQSKAFQTLEAAQQWARATEREMDIGAFINRNDAERTTFEDAAQRFIEEVLPGRRSGDRDLYKIKALMEVFGKYSLAGINPALISRYKDARLKIMSAQTVVHEINLLSSIFKACARDWGIALPQGIPTDNVRKPKVQNNRDRRLEPGEWDCLKLSLDECESPYPAAAAEFAIETAARQSEIASLLWEEVDLNKKTARLRGVNGDRTKNGDPYRDIPLSSRAVAILESLPRPIKGNVFQISQSALKQSWERAVERARRKHLHSRLSNVLLEMGYSQLEVESEIRALVFHKKKPRPATLQSLQKIEAADRFLCDLRFHDLRHEGTSRLADKLQLHELMKVTGHKSSAMLSRYYHPKASELALKLG